MEEKTYLGSLLLCPTSFIFIFIFIFIFASLNLSDNEDIAAEPKGGKRLRKRKEKAKFRGEKLEGPFSRVT